jgi:hypothetical protein
MIYQRSLLIPSGTTQDSPVSTTLEANKGFIYQVNVIIPSGCVGLAGVRILDGIYQAYPTTPNEWFIGDGTHHNFSDSYIKSEPPYSFTVEGYNLDDTYDHTITVMIGMEIKEIFIARFLPSYNIGQIIETITALQESQSFESTQLLKEALEFLKGS